MSRTFDITLPEDVRHILLSRLDAVADVVGIRVQPGASVKPPGDLVTVSVTNEGAHQVARILAELRVLDRGGVSISEPTALRSGDGDRRIVAEGNEAVWEEMSALLRRDTNPTANFILLMTLSGFVAGAGLYTDTLHIVIGAMLLAPGFEPFLRLVFGAVGRSSHTARMAAAAVLLGYGALATGAAVAALLLRLLGEHPPDDLGSRGWVLFWTTLNPSGILVALAAAAAGAVVVTSRRTVFAAGVMVALALVPTAAIAGMGLALGQPQYALWAGGRWLVEVVCILVAGAAVLGAKRALLHARPLLR